MLQDLRYGARMLLKEPGFTLVAILALALGIGANTTMFSSADALLLRPFSFPNQDRLAMIFERNPEIGITHGSVSPGNVAEWREQTQTLEEIVVLRDRDYTLTGDGSPERYTSYGVSAAFFDAIGVAPLLGRTFGPTEDQSGQAQVVVLKHAFWQTRFGADPQIIGKRILLDGEPFEIIGVMPGDFDFPYAGGEMWTPFVFEPQMRHQHGGHFLRVMALLKQGVSKADADADLRSISERIQRQFPDQEAGHIAYTVPLNAYYTRGARSAIPAMIGSALFVLLIACSNVANLLLARASGRRKEIAMRLALGATRWRLIRQLLIESVLLALIGGALGCFMAEWGVEAISKAVPLGMSEYIPGWSRLALSYRALGFAAVLSVLTALLFGLAPAWHSTRTNLNEALKEGGDRGTSRQGRRGLMRHALVVAQLALSVVLLAGAALFVRSFIQIVRADLGVNPDNAVTIKLELPADKYPGQPQRLAFYEQLLKRVESLPGVTHAGAVDNVPMTGISNSNMFQIVGQDPFAKGKEPLTQVRIVTPGYFAAIGTPLRSGRLLDSSDDAQAPRVALVNEAFVARYLKGSDAIGKRLLFTGVDGPTEIAGVVANVMNEDMDDLAEPGVYVAFAQVPKRQMTLVVRAPGAHTQIVPAVRTELAALDPSLPVSEVKTMEQLVFERRSPKQIMMWTLVIFAGIALLMAAVGTYAVMAYTVAQRTHEIGVRMALGALPHDIFRLVLRRGLVLGVIAIGLGLPAALAVTRVLRQFLYNVSPTDPLTFILVSLLLAAAALIACYVPARRATKVDPLVALRYE